MGTRIPVLRELPDGAGDQPASLTTTTRSAPEGGEKLLVLSRDQGLIDTLEVVGFPNEVHALGRDADLSAKLAEEDAAVVLLDAAAASRSIDRLTEELRSQFPDVVLIVAGGQADQIALAAQITDGTVYRFLAKPVSPQRIKLFLDAAWRRRGEQTTGADFSTRTRRSVGTAALAGSDTIIPSLPGARRNTWLIVAIAAAAVVTGGLVVFKLRGAVQPAAPGAQAPAAASASASAEPSLDDVLKRGQAALAQGDLDGAVQRYREALQAGPSDPRVADGVNQVIQKVLAAAQGQIQAGHLDQAELLAKQAWTLDPDNRQVAQMRAQLTDARDHASTPSASAAPAVVQAPPPSAAPAAPAAVVQATPERREPERAKPAGKVEEYLQRAKERMRQGNLVEPQDSARYFVAQARALAPNDPAVRQVDRQLIEQVTAEARKALSGNRLDEADRFIAAATDLGAKSEEIASLTRESQRDHAAAKADAATKVASLFNERLTQGKLLDPADDSAKFYLAQLSRSEPTTPSTQLARTAFGQRMLVEAQNATRHQDYTGARRWLAEARDAGVDTTTLSGAENDIQTAQGGPRGNGANSPPPPVPLKLTHYVEPVYPDLFRPRNLKGTVTVEFTVKTDGTTGDITVKSAQPAGVFDRAAVEAVRSWRYQPPLTRDGAPTTQRAQVPINFTP
jgi:TonB family protein